MEKTYFIYRYVRNDTNKPFYIGVGTKNETNSQGYINYSWQSVYTRAYSKDRSQVCKGIMSKTDCDIEILYETTDRGHAYEKEKEFIDLYGIIYDGSGTLVNLTKGGVSFKPTDELLKQNKFACQRVGKVFANFKDLYMFDLQGNFIEKFSALKGFYQKYGYGQSEGQGISAAIRNKTSCLGYLFSFSPTINPSEFRITNSSLPVVLYDKEWDPLNSAPTVREMARIIKAKGGTISLKIREQKLFKGYYFKQVQIHELKNIFNQ